MTMRMVIRMTIKMMIMTNHIEDFWQLLGGFDNDYDDDNDHLHSH